MDSSSWTLAGSAPAQTIARQGFARLDALQLRALAALDDTGAARLTPSRNRLLAGLGELFAQGERAAGREPPERWYIEAHQFRIDTSDGVGRPTPEGAHRDGVDYVAVILVERSDVRGGETRVFEADGPSGIRFVMSEAWSAVLLDDARMIHEATPIQPDGPEPHRDTLVLTYRRDGFQAPD